MLKFVARRLSVMALTALVLTFVVFFLTNLAPNLEKLARSEGSVRMTDDAVASWIVENGHGGSVFSRY
ncbi:MAG: ABC transporter permease, partial [Alphaproteobacteria bacterium]